MTEVLYLSGRDIESLEIGIGEIIDMVFAALSEHARGRVELPPKPGVHPRPGSLLHAMPAYAQDADVCGIKWVSAFPGNKARGLPNISGLVIINDPETGMPQAIMNAEWITAMRTAASAAVAARAMARRDAEVVGVLGPGVLGRSCVKALKHVLPSIRLVRAHAPNPSTRDRYKRDVEREEALTVDAVSTAEAAVRGADIVVTARPWPSVTESIESAWLDVGVFVCALDFDASLAGHAVSAFDRVACDDPVTFQIYQGRGYFAGWPAPDALSAVVTGLRPSREHDNERTLAVNIGIGLYDIIVAQQVRERAHARGVGCVVPF